MLREFLEFSWSVLTNVADSGTKIYVCYLKLHQTSSTLPTMASELCNPHHLQVP